MSLVTEAIEAPTSVGTTGASTDVSNLKAERRRFQFTGTAGDVIVIMASADGTNFIESYWMHGPKEELIVDHPATEYAAKRLQGTTSATLTVTGEETPAQATLTIEVPVTHADLTAAATSQAINLGDPLPANAQVLGVAVALDTPFSGGGASAVSVDIGSSGDVDAIVDGANLFAAAVDGQASTRPAGIAPNKVFVSPGAQLTATFISDVNVAALTAGSATIRLFCAVLTP